MKLPTMVVIVAAVLIAWCAPGWAADQGTTEGTPSAVTDASNQSVRVAFSASEGCFRLAAAGVNTRSSGSPTVGGPITLPAGPAAGNVVWAGLYWVILGDAAAPVNAVTLNGSPVAPVLLGITGSPCFGQINAYAYFADVTPLVVAGVNTVAGMDDDGVNGSGFDAEGASLIVVYESAASAACEIIVTDGNDLVDMSGQIIDNPLPVTCPAGASATLVLVAGDGQTASDSHFWNAANLGDGDDFDDSDPEVPGAQFGWDTDAWSVVIGPPNLASAGSGSDCFNWVATAIEVGVTDCTPVSVDDETWGGVKGHYR